MGLFLIVTHIFTTRYSNYTPRTAPGEMKTYVHTKMCTQMLIEAIFMGCLDGLAVKRPALDFGSGQDLAVCEMEPHFGFCADGMEPAWDSLSLSLSLSLSAPSQTQGK